MHVHVHVYACVYAGVYVYARMYVCMCMCTYDHFEQCVQPLSPATFERVVDVFAPIGEVCRCRHLEGEVSLKQPGGHRSLEGGVSE